MNTVTGVVRDKGRLESWKEIAAYLGRGTRTVQRWEREEALPVYRLQHDKLGSVYAYPSELDAWFERRAARPAPAAEEGPSVAVLPFADLSQEKDQGYFCDGVAEEIIHALSQVRELKTASRAAAFRFRGVHGSPREVGRALGVKTLLEGSVRKAGERLRIAVELLDVDSGFQLWAQRFDRELRDIFEIQDEIAANVMRALEVTLGPRERPAPAKDVAAYDCYLRGRKFYYGYTIKSVEFAIRMFCEAIKLDPNYAQAYAGLADCWSYLYLYSERNDILREQADWASQKAQAMEPGCAQAQASRGLSLSLAGRNEEADAAFAEAARLDPELFEAHYFRARHWYALGRKREAVGAYEAAMRVRPEDYQAALLVAQSYDDLGKAAEAEAARRKGVAAAERHLQMNPDDTRALYMVANGLIGLGQRERGRQRAEAALAMGGEDPMVLYNVGCVFSMLGDVEKALDCLEKAARGGLTQKGWYEHDSNLDPVRTHARFRALMEGLGRAGDAALTFTAGSD